MNKTRHYIQILLLMLLLLAGSGTGNGAWAKKVTYHILTKPFTVRNYNNTGDYLKNIRVEALQCTSEESTVGLPERFKSPLATNFRYWAKTKTEKTSYGYLYDYGHSTNVVEAKYYIYQCSEGDPDDCLSDQILNPEGTDASAYNDIYVTYDYKNDKEDLGWRNGILELNGETNYTVTIYNSATKYLCYNRSRNNRVANALASGISGEELASDDFVVPENGSGQLGWKWSKWGPIGVHLGFKFLGQDPYNFTIMTSYVGDEIHITDKTSVDGGKATIKPYKDATLFGKINNTQMWFDASNDKHYKVQSGCNSETEWTDEKYAACKVTYYATAEAARYDTWVGFYRKEIPTMNTYALLSHPNGGGYMIVGSKMNQGNKDSKTPTIYQPNKSGQYYTYYDSYDSESGNRRSQPYFKIQDLANAHLTNFYEIRTYTLKLKTHGSNTVLTTTMKWSDAVASEKILDHVPVALKRKYAKFTGAYAEKDEGGVKQADTSNPISTFADAHAKGNVIWLEYETDTDALPFEFLPQGGDYVDAHWYTMRVNGKAEQKNIAYNSGNDFITGSSSRGSETDLHYGENSADVMVAFMGDPYELQIISRATSVAAGANRYISCAKVAVDGTTLNTDKIASSDFCTWEIMYESTDAGNFVLRQFNTVANPKYIGWSTDGNKPIIYSSTATRIRVVELEKKKYAFHIMRSDHSIAVMATASLDVGTALNSYNDIPKVIRSPYLKGAEVYFYDTKAKAETNAPATKITNAPYDADADNLIPGVYANIYVRYSTSARGDDYNVNLNGEFIYTSTTLADDNIYSKRNITTEASSPTYKWSIDYTDPYAMTLKNVGKNKFINVSSPADDMALGWDESATPFIVKQSGDNDGIFEVMYATGDAVDASETYYNIGRNISSTTENAVKLYQNSTYSSGYAQLRFLLIATTATDVTYHLIDKANTDLLQVIARHINTDDAYFPVQYRSPLVSTYYYYATEADAINGVNPITKVGDCTNIYVTYKVNDLIDLKAGQLYLLKYEAGEEFRQEDGGDGLLPAKTPEEIAAMSEEEKAAYTKTYKAVYPYCNGDCNFFVYGQEQYELQQEGAASTRTRWAWYVESDNNDPYHVKIMSRQSESYPISNSYEYNAYFATYQPTDYTEAVTTLTWPGITGIPATEYMVLGNVGQYQLVTSYPITVSYDENENGIIDLGETTSERYVLNSFEQYWKTWDTIRKKVYGESKAKENDSDPIIIPNGTRAKYGTDTEQLLRDYLKNDLNWHSYENWAYAKRWNGYNNGYSSTEGKHETKKGWEKIEHWYQTVSMGEGYFDFVETSIDPVLILLDQHGWEIMRKPLPTSPDDLQKDAKYEVIRPYNSPMVKEYAFWATAKKRSGFHQYYLLSDRIGGDDFTSTDLTNLPPYTSKNVHDKKGNLNDQYVTYIVKDEYAQTYNPADKTAKPFLIEQGSKYASTLDGETITKNDVSSVVSMQKHITDVNIIPDSEQWYVKPNINIDDEMGYGNAGHSWTEPDQKNPNAYDDPEYKDNKIAVYIDQTDKYKNADADGKKTIKDKYGLFSFSNGFDPYNIQISSVSASSKYMKTNANGATLEEGSLIGSYPTVPGTVAMGDNTTIIPSKPKWYDNRDLDVTNATFMAVQDANGNMQLMPRFDHATRMSEFGELIAPTSSDAAKTYTKLYRAEKYQYFIIDNSGYESLRYKSGGELKPQTPDHFKSPLAVNFTYYTDAACTHIITESLDGVTLSSNKIYVRYEYNEEGDDIGILKGNWLTMQLNKLNVYYKSNSLYGTNSHALTADDSEDMTDQAKKLTETGDYYFKVDNDGNYYKVHVTSAYVDEVYARFETDDATETQWNDATEGFKKEATDNDDMISKAQRLGANGDYFFKIGADKYVKVTVTNPYSSAIDAEYTKPIGVETSSSNWDASKPLTVDADAKKWQWKFLQNQQSTPDPYAVYLFNHDNKDEKLLDGSRFAILSHSSGDYALAKAGLGNYTYQFLNDDGGMSTSEAAKIATEPNFNSLAGTFIGTNSQVKLGDEVQHNYIYKVYTNSGVFAISANQTQEEVYNNDWAPRIPDGIKTPLLNLDQFLYYSKDNVRFGTGEPGDKPTTDIASIDTDKKLSYLYGLYDDEVVVRYAPYDRSETEYQVPNVRNAIGGTVAKDADSNDAPLDLSQTLVYNIIWYNDNMMTTTTGTDVVGHANQELTMDNKYEWKIGGNDPYAMTFYNVNAEKYITAAPVADGTTCTLTDNATPFMLLPKDEYAYGMLAITGNEGYKLTITDDENTGTKEAAKITIGDPAKFIIFALATHKVIYHLMIRKIGDDIIVPYYRGTDLNGTLEENKKVGTGSTMRDLTSKDTSSGGSDHPDGDLYQLGETLKAIGLRAGSTTGLYAEDIIYCYDAGHISLGDELEVPSVFYRPNVDYSFIVEGVYNDSGAEVETISNKYKGWETKTMGDNDDLLDKTVIIYIVYRFKNLDTNLGSGFVTNVNQNKWYSFDTNNATPRLAQYTTLEGLKAKSGFATHYTNDYLWTPVGDPYGFKMYNRYACKNLKKTNLVMTTASIGNNIDVTMGTEDSNGGMDIYELIAVSTTTPGYFRVHPMMNMNKNGATQYYMNIDSSNGNLKLSTIPAEWEFGLYEDMMRPYYQRAGYVGGLNEAGKSEYEKAAAKTNTFEKLTSIQEVVYNHDNDNTEDHPTNPNYIVHYTPGYYRLHSQPDSESITTPRYLSGYTHKIELIPGTGTVGSPTAIPLHFYEQTSYDVNNPVFKDLESGEYTITNATKGDIPLSTVTNDPASIFYFAGVAAASPSSNSPSSTMQTQGLYVKENKMMATAGNATSFTITDIGGGIVILYSGTPANYLSYDQSSAKYDIKYGSDIPARTARWCMQPVQKLAILGSGEMGLQVPTNSDGKGNYLATFCAPFNVLLTSDKDEAFVLPKAEWPTTTPDIIHLHKIGKYNTGTYEGNSQFIPAGIPVIIRTSNTVGYVTMALPTPPGPLDPSVSLDPESFIFSGKYLEQKLEHGDDYVYVFGRSLGTFEKGDNFGDDGLFKSITPEVSTKIGFYVNANPDKEAGEFKDSWTRNNKYVLHNKIYYRAGDNGASSRELTRSPEFIPVVFDDEEGEEDEPIEESLRQQVFNGCVYDLQGRCVATEEMVKDGTWRHNLKHGIYILNGKKIYVK